MWWLTCEPDWLWYTIHKYVVYICVTFLQSYSISRGKLWKIIILPVHKINKKAILGRKRSKKNCHLRKWKLGSAERWQVLYLFFFFILLISLKPSLPLVLYSTVDDLHVVVWSARLWHAKQGAARSFHLLQLRCSSLKRKSTKNPPVWEKIRKVLQFLLVQQCNCRYSVSCKN
jgi:hypothetical protein